MRVTCESSWFGRLSRWTHDEGRLSAFNVDEVDLHRLRGGCRGGERYEGRNRKAENHEHESTHLVHPVEWIIFAKIMPRGEVKIGEMLERS